MTFTRPGAAHTPAGSPPNCSVKPRRASSTANEAVAAGTADPVSGLTATPHPSVAIRLILFGSGGVRVAVRSSLRQAMFESDQMQSRVRPEPGGLGPDFRP